MSRVIIRFPDLDYLIALDLAGVNRQAADLTAQAQAFVSDVNRIRRAAIRAAVDGPGVTGRRRERVEAVAAQLGISRTQVYQAIRADAMEPESPRTLMEVLAEH
jgi:hypothetical protein